MSDKVDKMITNRNMRYIPWYALGALGGSITFMGISGVALIYTIFITTLVMSCGLKSYYDYLVNSDSNFVIKNVKNKIDESKAKLSEGSDSTNIKKLRWVFNFSSLLKVISFLAFIVIISMVVNSLLFWNPTLLYASLSHAIVASIVYYMVSFLLNVMSIVKYREL